MIIRHHERIRALRIDQKQKNFQTKYEHSNTSPNLEKIIYDVNDETKRNFKKNDKLSHKKKLTKKNIRNLRRNKAKEEMREESRFQMKTHRERAKEDCIGSHGI